MCSMYLLVMGLGSSFVFLVSNFLHPIQWVVTKLRTNSLKTMEKLR